MVVLGHADLYLGYKLLPQAWMWFSAMLGVFIFFTHTTLVLMWSLQRDPHTLRFYIRRAFRIYPLWLVVLFLSVAIKLPTSPALAPHFGYLKVGWREMAENALLVFNLEGPGCRLIGASWSLPVEVQMYVVLPLLFFFIRSNRSVWPLLVLDVLAMATARRMDSPIAADLLFSTPLFLPGAIAYVGFEKWRSRLPAWLFPVRLVLLIGSVDRVASLRRHSFRYGWLFALILGLSLPLFAQITWRPLVRGAHLVAKYSYGIYLSHFAAFAVGFYYLRAFSLPVRVAAFAASFAVLPVIFYHTVEKPMISVGSRIARRFEWGPEPRIDERELGLEMAP